MTVFTTVLEREEEYPSLNLAAPSMVTRESEASRSTPALRNPTALGYRPRPSLVWALVAPIPRLAPVALAAYDAPGYSSPLFAVIETDPLLNSNVVLLAICLAVVTVNWTLVFDPAHHKTRS
ncbi:MAG: hypothetical protein V3R51_04210 [Gammaproteobacteria bacterium]